MLIKLVEPRDPIAGIFGVHLHVFSHPLPGCGPLCFRLSPLCGQRNWPGSYTSGSLLSAPQQSFMKTSTSLSTSW